MTRKKVKLAFIANDSARKATYKKRKRGLLKKMDELTTLCDVKACAILYSPYEARPVVWPHPSGAREVISSFKRLPEMEKVKKMVSQEEFMRQRVAKAHEQLKRQQKENREKEMTQVMYQCLTGKTIQNMSLLDLSDLGWVINQHLCEINKRIEALNKKENNPPPPPNDNNISNNNSSSPPPPAQLPSQHLVGPESRTSVLQGQKEDFDTMQQMQMMMQPWSSFMDMMGPSIMHDHHHHHPHPHHSHHPHHHHHQMGIVNGLSSGGNGSGSSSTSNININSSGNNMNNMMMMMSGQFGDYQGHGVNTALWSNAFFP